MARACIVLVLCCLLRSTIACEGEDFVKMSEVLEEVEDWKKLASTLKFKASQPIAIAETCSSSLTPAQCQRRMLLRTYCDMMGLVEVEFVAESIANALDALYEKELAARMRKLYHQKDLQQCSDETECNDVQSEIMFPSEGFTAFLFLTLFSKECEHDRDYLRLFIIVAIFVSVIGYSYYRDIDLFESLIPIGISMVIPFLLYSLIFYYPLIFSPCYCFVGSILYIAVMLLFALVWLMVFMMLLCSCFCVELFRFFLDYLTTKKKEKSEEDNKKDYFKESTFGAHLIAVFFFLYCCAYFWLLNEYFC